MRPGYSKDRWFYRPAPQEEGRRLFCFPYAGGNAAVYRSWARGLSAVEICAVQLPGRSLRLAEPPLFSLEEFLEEFLPALLPWLDRPFLFFGHSLGAVLAFEVTRRLRQEGSLLPEALFLSGHEGPQYPPSGPSLHLLPQEALLDELRRLGGTPREVLQEPELVELFLPALRADFELAETWPRQKAEPLSLPLYVFGGEEDRFVSAEGLGWWESETTGPFSLSLLPGDHFFLHSAEPLLLRSIASLL